MVGRIAKKLFLTERGRDQHRSTAASGPSLLEPDFQVVRARGPFISAPDFN
jgi:hypothetical protein